MGMGCEERSRLLRAYEDAANSYAKAVLKFSDVGSFGLKTEYDAVHRAAEHARSVAAGAREALEKHIAEHVNCAAPLAN